MQNKDVKERERSRINIQAYHNIIEYSLVNILYGWPKLDRTEICVNKK